MWDETYFGFCHRGVQGKEGGWTTIKYRKGECDR